MDIGSMDDKGLRQQRDLNDVVGTWSQEPTFDRAVAAQDAVDEEMWR